MKKLEISLGNDCNASCVFCYSPIAKDKMKMPYKKIVEVLRNHVGFLSVAFTGGEPTIRPDIFSIIGQAKKIGYENVELKTNLFLLSYPSFISKLEKSGLDSVSFSIFCADDKQYADITKVSKAFAYVKKALANLKDTNFSLVANILLSKYASDSIVQMVNLLLKHNVKSFLFWYVSTSELKGDNSYLMQKISSFKKELFDSVELIESKGITDVKILHIPPCMLGKKEKYYMNERLEDITVVDMNSSFRLDEESFSDLIKTDKCEGCKHSDRCAGLRKDYYEKFGDGEIGA